MINQEKVKDMTKMAIYESHGGDKELAVSAYRRKDYVALQLLKTFILGTVSFVILTLFYLFGKMDTMESLSSITEAKPFAIGTVVLYVIFIAVFMLITFFLARRRYEYCSAQAKSYSTELNRVARSYQDGDDSKR